MEAESIFWSVPILKLSTAGVLWVRRCCRIWGQSAKTPAGSPVDQLSPPKHPSNNIKKSIKKGGEDAPLKYTQPIIDLS